MKRKALFLVLIFAVAFETNTVHAQDRLSDSLMFTVRKDFRPTVIKARKLSIQPIVQHDTVALPDMKYETPEAGPELDPVYEPLKAARLGRESLPKLYNGYIKAGFGNYTMPLFEASFSSLRHKKYQAGGFGRYHASFASLNGRPFGFTDAGATVFGKYFMKHHVLSSDIEYRLNEHFFYGYDPSEVTLSKDSIRQLFHHVRGTIELRTSQEKKLRIFDNASLSYEYARDRFGSDESRASLSGGVVIPVKLDMVRIRTVLDAYHDRTLSSTDDDLIFGLEPEFSMKRTRWGLDAGFKFYVDGRKKHTRPLLFPTLRFHYFLAQDMIRFYLNATGGIQKNSLSSISQTNPYAYTDILRQNTYERLNVQAGLKGNIFQIIGFDISVAEILSQQQLFFVNDTSDGIGNRFIAEYHDTRITQFEGSVSYGLSEKLFVQATARYRLFDMRSDSIMPWNEAPFTFNLSGHYNLKDKFIFTATITAAGNRKAKGYSSDSTGTHMKPIDMGGYADLSIGAEYRYRHWISAFIDLRNIAAMRYEIWNQYPVQRFSFIAGLKFTF